MGMPPQKQIASGQRAAPGKIGFGLQIHPTAAIYAFFQLALLAQQTPPQTVKGLTAAPGLEVKLWASEPDLVNPTNIDIDSRGRIWVLGAVNYRRQLKGEKDYRNAGDRIVILEDPGHTGGATKAKVLAQGPSIRSPLGISVLGDQVIVSQSPKIIVYTKDEDGPAGWQDYFGSPLKDSTYSKTVDQPRRERSQ
jgi:hypothetical protein